MTQGQRIIEYISIHGSITTFEAFMNLGIACLPKRISELKKAGYPIEKGWATTQNRYGEPVTYMKYSLGDANG